MVQGIFNVIYTLAYNALMECNLYQPKVSRYSTIGYDEIVAFAAKAASIPESDMRMTMEALMEAFSYYLCNGHSFKLDGVGTFSLSANTSTGDPTSPDCLEGADAVKRLHINFLPDAGLRSLCNGLSIHTTTENPDGLVPMTAPMLRSLTFNGARLVAEGEVTAEGAREMGRNTVEVNGFNIPQNPFAVIINGQNASGQETSHTLSMKGTSKACLYARGVYTANTIAKITSVVVFGRQYDIVGNPDSVTVGSVKFGESNIFDGAVVTAGSEYIVVTGSRLAGQTIRVDGEPLELSESSDSRISAMATLSAGVHTINVADLTYSVTATREQSAPSVESLTANGVSAQNGSTSPVRSGSTYNFVAVGQNLGSIQASDISVPQGAVMSGFSGSDERIAFTVTFGSQDGQVRIGEYFYVGIIINDPAQTVTSIGSVGNGGSITLQKGANQLPIVSSAPLQKSQISTSNGNIVIVNVLDGNLNMLVMNSGDVTVTDADDPTLTIFTFHVNQEGESNTPVFICANVSGEGTVSLDEGEETAALAVPVTQGTHYIRAIHADGFRFSHWTNQGQEQSIGDSEELALQITSGGRMVTAHFVPEE